MAGRDFKETNKNKLLDKQSSNELINADLLAIRYQDSLDVITTKEDEKNKELVHTCKAMLLGYGSTHASYYEQRGLFFDPYHREAIPVPDDEDDYSLFTEMLTRVQQEVVERILPHWTDIPANSFFPINNFDVLKELPGSNFYDVFIDHAYSINIAGKTISIVQVKEYHSESEISSARKIIGQLAQFPNKDLQLWIIAPEEEYYFILLFSKLYNNILRRFEEQDTPLTLSDQLQKISTYYTPSKQTSSQIKEKILALLVKYHVDPEQDSRMQLFKTLVEQIDIADHKNQQLNEQIRLSLSRLEYILQNATIHTQDKFSLFLEFAFDEVMFLNKLTQHTSTLEIEKIIKHFIQTQYVTKRDVSVGLGNSCLDVVDQNIMAAIREAKTSKESFKIRFGNDLYFEMIYNFTNYSKFSKSLQDVPREACITYSNGKAELNEYRSDDVCDIVVCDFFSSVSVVLQKHIENPIESLIEEQLALRKKLPLDVKQEALKQPKRLIVLVETTLNAFDDGNVMLLLERFDKEIASGELAIIVTSSLNKYFHMGFDKTPAGLSAAFYKTESFPALAAFHQANILMNYSETDPSIQMISSLLKNQPCVDHILMHYNKVKRKSRYIYKKLMLKNKPEPSNIEKLISKEDDPIISVYDPFSGLFQTWGFVVFKVNHSVAHTLLEEMVERLEFGLRGGYGYAHSTYSSILDKVIRISIGSEDDMHTLGEKLEILVNYASEINRVYSLYKDSDNTTELDKRIMEIRRSYLKIADSVKSTEPAEKKLDFDSVIPEALQELPLDEKTEFTYYPRSGRHPVFPVTNVTRSDSKDEKETKVTPTEAKLTVVVFNTPYLMSLEKNLVKLDRLLNQEELELPPPLKKVAVQYMDAIFEFISTIRSGSGVRAKTTAEAWAALSSLKEELALVPLPAEIATQKSINFFKSQSEILSTLQNIANDIDNLTIRLEPPKTLSKGGWTIPF